MKTVNKVGILCDIFFLLAKFHNMMNINVDSDPTINFSVWIAYEATVTKLPEKWQFSCIRETFLWLQQLIAFLLLFVSLTGVASLLMGRISSTNAVASRAQAYRTNWIWLRIRNFHCGCKKRNNVVFFSKEKRKKKCLHLGWHCPLHNGLCNYSFWLLVLFVSALL